MIRANAFTEKDSCKLNMFSYLLKNDFQFSHNMEVLSIGIMVQASKVDIKIIAIFRY